MSVVQNADGSWSAFDAGGNVLISSTSEQAARDADARAGSTGTPSSTSSTTSGTPAAVGYNPAQQEAAAKLADQAAYREYLKARLELDREQGVMRDEREKDRIANERARDAWTKTYQTAQLSGYMPEAGDWGGGSPGTAGQAIPGTYSTKNGNKTVAQMRAELATAGYPDAQNADEGTIASVYAQTTGGPVTQATTAGTPGAAGPGRGQRVLDAIGQLRANPQYLALDGAGRQQMEAAAVAQATGVPVQTAAALVQRLRALTATTGQMSSAGLVESVLGQLPGGAGTPTLEREAEQNRTTIQALTLLSQLRGPENAFAYANTLANLPESIRSNIQAAMGRLPFTAQNPAQRGLFGDVGLYGGMEMQAGPTSYQAQGLPAATGPRTAQAGALSYLPSPAAAVPQQPAGAFQPLTQGYPAQTATPQQQDAAYMRWAANKAQARARGEMVTEEFMAPPEGFAQRNPGYDPMTFQVPSGQAAGNGAVAPTTFGPRTQPASGVPGLPFRAGGLSPTDYLRTNDYAKRLMWAGYENQGGDINAGQWEYNASLPNAVGPRFGRYRAA